ncbi:hypothetical protein GF359_06590 [candidate division WOR-3 bacterium]|uniref:Uncharacterized protein n=1 Tax=candidate division WOR-3 bacterium TaxID=2052148 RepID=A0A9D5KBT7_UNCW3|nr:hypothetical protein [candidate division WOR-3 bacterium]MBD3364866.1 hypothetical protein [candidate division WOR-3 bacterium]
MSGRQSIKNYTGAYRGIRHKEYSVQHVKTEHAMKAWNWVKQRSWNNHYVYNYEVLDLTSGWVNRIKKGMGITDIQVGVGYFDDICAKAEYFKTGGWMRIILSRWCTSLGVMRAMAMHEFMEVYAGITKFGRTTHGLGIKANDYACNIVNQFEFEDNWERRLRD